jgi:hypothetical protein
MASYACRKIASFLYTSIPQMKRRQFIISLLGYLTSLIISRQVDSSPRVRRSGHDDNGLEISLLFSNHENARIVGNSYLAQYPERADRNSIIAELGLPSLEPGGDKRNILQQWANESQRRDFTVGDTVMVNNWILSRTEANLCALMALS